MKIVKLNMGETYRRNDEDIEHRYAIDMELKFINSNECAVFNSKLVALLIEYKDKE